MSVIDDDGNWWAALNGAGRGGSLFSPRPVERSEDAAGGLSSHDAEAAPLSDGELLARIDF